MGRQITKFKYIFGRQNANSRIREGGINRVTYHYHIVLRMRDTEDSKSSDKLYIRWYKALLYVCHMISIHLHKTTSHSSLFPSYCDHRVLGCGAENNKPYHGNKATTHILIMYCQHSFQLIGSAQSLTLVSPILSS